MVFGSGIGSLSALVPGGSSFETQLDSIYSVEPKNWYQSKPYGFTFYSRNVQGETTALTGTKVTFWLPINPENINVTTHFATNVVTTLYGVVEEHSEVRYYDIDIAGTTGYGPKYYAQEGNANPGITASLGGNKHSSDGRQAFQAGFLENVSLPGGLGGGVLGAAQQIAGSVSDITGGNASKTGINIHTSGYVAFHNFYRFLLAYKQDGAGIGPDGFTERKVHPLRFLNYKDRVKYNCIPLHMRLTRSAESPMLYNYNIKMRAFNLRPVDAPDDGDVQGQLLAQLGLAQGAFDQFNNALGAVSGAVGAVGSLLG